MRVNECQFNYGDSQIDGITMLQSCGKLEDAWACIAPITESDQQIQTSTETDDELTETAIPELIQMPKQVRSNLCTYEVHESAWKALLRSMNTIQKEVFYKIRYWCIRCRNEDHTLTPFHLFVAFGVGISHSIKFALLFAIILIVILSVSIDADTVSSSCISEP